MTAILEIEGPTGHLAKGDHQWPPLRDADCSPLATGTIRAKPEPAPALDTWRKVKTAIDLLRSGTR